MRNKVAGRRDDKEWDPRRGHLHIHLRSLSPIGMTGGRHVRKQAEDRKT